MRSDEKESQRSGVTGLPAFLRPRKERMKFMSQKIRLNETADVKEFVQAASKCDFDVDISYNRILIDAKSILGILSMDLTRVLTVTCHGEDHEFDRFLQKYAVA